MTKPIDYRKVVEEFNPNVSLLKGFDRHILSVNLHNDRIEVFYSLWGVLKQMMVNDDLDYDKAMRKLILKVQEEHANKSDLMNYFYDDLPNPQLN
jgi:hypothetical protein